MVIAGASWMLGRAAASPTQTPPTTSTIRVARRSRVALVAVVIAAAGSGGPGRAEPQLSQPSLDSGRMRSSLTPLGPPVSRDRVIASFPKDRCRGRDPLHGMAFCISDSAAKLVRRSGTRRKPVCSSGSTSTGRSALPANTGTWGLSGSNSPRWWWLAISTWGRPASSTGFARMFLIETTRPPLGWTLKLSTLRLLGFPIASRSGTQLGRRSSSASHLPTTGVPRVSNMPHRDSQPRAAAGSLLGSTVGIPSSLHKHQFFVLQDPLRKHPGHCLGTGKLPSSPGPA
ncbi:ras-related protein Rab-36 isoform X4 [Hylobates moloch]|uniref:ras-related protein Rab-36 isoform X4 n=1 Tax=Hylobates moloch TaxID=81572 RepID=UPI002675B2BE|nr:ras-related protein Rab-36 isoform X4 [Hylobates moloch]